MACALSSGLNVPVTSMSPTSEGVNRMPQRGKEQCKSVCVTAGREPAFRQLSEAHAIKHGVSGWQAG